MNGPAVITDARSTACLQPANCRALLVDHECMKQFSMWRITPMSAAKKELTSE